MLWSGCEYRSCFGPISCSCGVTPSLWMETADGQTGRLDWEPNRWWLCTSVYWSVGWSVVCRWIAAVCHLRHVRSYSLAEGVASKTSHNDHTPFELLFVICCEIRKVRRRCRVRWSAPWTFECQWIWAQHTRRVNFPLFLIVHPLLAPVKAWVGAKQQPPLQYVTVRRSRGFPSKDLSCRCK